MYLRASANESNLRRFKLAKVTFINAILSGKLEGQIYSRNKGGYYVKGWSKPLDPATSAQLSNRSRLSSAASSWHSLTDIQKAAWNAFGASIYVPKGAYTQSVVSGFNAFTALRNAVLFANARSRTNTITTPSGATLTTVPFGFLSTPPAKPLSGMIKDNASLPLALNLTAGSLVASTGAITADLTFDRTISAAPLFTDSVSSTPVGVVIEASNPLTQGMMFVSNPGLRVLNVLKPPTLAGTWTSATKMTLSAAAADINIASFKTWYTVGQTVQLQAYLLSVDGQYKSIGACKIVVT